jgi:hypothetical protein
MRPNGCKERDGGLCPAPALRLDRTKPLSCSAAELGPFAALQNGPADSPRRCVRIRNCSASAGPEPSRKSQSRAHHPIAPAQALNGGGERRREGRSTRRSGCSGAGSPVLCARGTPTMKLWSFDARSGGPAILPLGRESKRAWKDHLKAVLVRVSGAARRATGRAGENDTRNGRLTRPLSFKGCQQARWEHHSWGDLTRAVEDQRPCPFGGRASELGGVRGGSLVYPSCSPTARTGVFILN